MQPFNQARIIVAVAITVAIAACSSRPSTPPTASPENTFEGTLTDNGTQLSLTMSNRGGVNCNGTAPQTSDFITVTCSNGENTTLFGLREDRTFAAPVAFRFNNGEVGTAKLRFQNSRPTTAS